LLLGPFLIASTGVISI